MASDMIVRNNNNNNNSSNNGNNSNIKQTNTHLYQHLQIILSQKQ